jgi:CubicO group peptidase (beta-lactamase class C family)
VDDLESSVDHVAAATGFSGVVRVDRGGRVEFAKAYGPAHRGYGIPNAVDTRFGLASGTKGLTALSIMSLIEAGRLDLDTTARSVLGEDLPLIHDDVTVEHLLAHRSGIGDYFDEDEVESMTDYVCTGWQRPRTTSPSWMGMCSGSHPASGSLTTTAASSFWR